MYTEALSHNRPSIVGLLGVIWRCHRRRLCPHWDLDHDSTSKPYRDQAVCSPALVLERSIISYSAEIVRTDSMIDLLIVYSVNTGGSLYRNEVGYIP